VGGLGAEEGVSAIHDHSDTRPIVPRVADACAPAWRGVGTWDEQEAERIGWWHGRIPCARGGKWPPVPPGSLSQHGIQLGDTGVETRAFAADAGEFVDQSGAL
jgi:hypothetical protein